MHMGNHFPDAAHFRLDDFIGNARLGNLRRDLAPEGLFHVVDDGFMPLAAQLPGHGKPRWAASDDGDALARKGRQRGQFGVDARLAQLRQVESHHVGRSARAALHAEVGAQVPADGRGKGRVGQGQVHGFVGPAFADESPPFVHWDSRGATCLAGGRILTVFPYGHPATQFSGGDEGNGRAVNVREVPDESSLAQLSVPHIPVEFLHGQALLADFFHGAASRQLLPFFSDAHGVEQFGAADGFQVGFQVAQEPVPVRLGNGHLFGIGLAVALVGTSKENAPSHHAHAGAVSHHIAAVLGHVAADHGDAARHEFGEVVSHGTQHPEFGGIEAGIVLGHGHAASSDVARHVNLPLGHGVGRSVARVAVDDDPGTPVEPPHVVGSGSHDFDGGVGKSHGPHPLAGGTQYLHIHGLLPGFPQSAADAMLPESFDFQIPASLLHRLLDALLDDARLDAVIVLQTGYAHGLFTFHTHSLQKYAVNRVRQKPAGRPSASR